MSSSITQPKKRIRPNPLLAWIDNAAYYFLEQDR
jgi:hypothetical protein